MYDDEDVNVVDVDNAGEGSTQPPESVDSQVFYAQPPRTIAESVIRSSRRRSTPPVGTGINTRSSNAKPKAKPKLKLKLSEKATAAMASGTSFLGPYDRELDSDDEDLSFEEQFILRLPPGEDLERLRKLVASREAGNDIWFKFKGWTQCLLIVSLLISFLQTPEELSSILEIIYTLQSWWTFLVS